MKNKKGMLANLVGGFIVILVGISLMGTISQEIDNIQNCNQTLMNESGLSYDVPLGATDSFGGAGSGHFGGYDGEVKKSWSSNLAPIKTNESVLFGMECPTIPNAGITVLKLVPFFFIIGVLFVGAAIAYTGLRDAGAI